MNRVWLSVAGIVLLVTQLFCAQPPATPPSDLSIGQIEKIKGGVQVGPETALANVEPRLPIYNHDMVHVFDKGKANLDFGAGLSFTLYNDTTSGGTSVSMDDTTRQAAISLSQGGLKGHNPEGTETTVKVADSINIVILGTSYFITYDEVEDKVWVYNFDGTMEYQLPNGETQPLPPRTLVEITGGQVTNVYSGMLFSVDDFDVYATEKDSPILGVEALLDGAPCGAGPWIRFQDHFILDNSGIVIRNRPIQDIIRAAPENAVLHRADDRGDIRQRVGHVDDDPHPEGLVLDSQTKIRAIRREQHEVALILAGWVGRQ